jgi:carbamoyl-phosphate synthase large subunit
MGKKLKELLKADRREISYFGVKEAVFPFIKFPDVDPVLGPEMKSTGEVMGIAPSFGPAFYKAESAAGMTLPMEGTVLISVADKDKEEIVEVADRLDKLGFKIVATKGTHAFLQNNGTKCEVALKLHEGRPNIIDNILNKRIQMIINTPVGRESKVDDSYIRKTAVQHKIPYITTIAAARAAVDGIEALKYRSVEVKSIQEYHKEVDV